MTAGVGDLYCFRKTFVPAAVTAPYEMAIIPGPKIFVTR